MKYILGRLLFRRISQLPLKGFHPPWWEKPKNKISPIGDFFKALFKYSVHRLSNFGKKVANSFTYLAKFISFVKEYSIKKLIWSRGRLGRPIANLIVLSVAFLVFTFGELLSGQKFVNSQEIDADYIKVVTDVIPNRQIAATAIPDERKRSESFTYTIQSGDSLSTVGEKFKISVDALEYVNGLTDSSILSIGDVLTIPPVTGLIHKVVDGDTLDSIAKKYDVAPQGIADFNYILDTSTLAVGTELVIPGGSVPTPVIPVVPTYGSSPTYAVNTPNLGDGFVWPTTVRIITQYFSWYHNGLDIAVPWGWGMPPLFASSSGTVTRSGWDPWGLGLHVAIDHGNGFETVYGHMSRIDVGYGQRVSKGQHIGLMGNTGRSTGPHVHFIIKYNGVAQNPSSYVN